MNQRDEHVDPAAYAAGPRTVEAGVPWELRTGLTDIVMRVLREAERPLDLDAIRFGVWTELAPEWRSSWLALWVGHNLSARLSQQTAKKHLYRHGRLWSAQPFDDRLHGEPLEPPPATTAGSANAEAYVQSTLKLPFP